MIDWCIFILLSRESDGALCFGRIRTRLGVDHFSKLSCWRFDFFPRKFAACSKPPSRDNYRKASYPRTQQRDQGAGWTHDPTIRVVVNTTPLPIRPRCRHISPLRQHQQVSVHLPKQNYRIVSIYCTPTLCTKPTNVSVLPMLHAWGFRRMAREPFVNRTKT